MCVWQEPTGLFVHGSARALEIVCECRTSTRVPFGVGGFGGEAGSSVLVVPAGFQSSSSEQLPFPSDPNRPE